MISLVKMSYFVEGCIICIFKKGKNNGIDIFVDVGSLVKVVVSGSVVVIIIDVDDVIIVVICYVDNVMMVYYNVVDVLVFKSVKVLCN